MPEPVEAAKGAAGGVGNVLTKKVGPLPVWGYAVALGGGLLALRLIHPGASNLGGVGVASPAPASAASGGNPAGSGANLIDPPPANPVRQAPPPQDTPVPIVVLPPSWYPTLPTITSPTQPQPTSQLIPSTPSLQPTASVQPFIPPLLTDAGLYNISGVNYSLTAEGLARAAKGVPNVGAPVGAPMQPAPVSSPSGPSVPSAPVQAPAPGSRFEMN